MVFEVRLGNEALVTFRTFQRFLLRRATKLMVVAVSFGSELLPADVTLVHHGILAHDRNIVRKNKSVFVFLRSLMPWHSWHYWYFHIHIHIHSLHLQHSFYRNQYLKLEIETGWTWANGPQPKFYKSTRSQIKSNYTILRLSFLCAWP